MTLFSTALPETRLSLFVGFIVVIGSMMYPANKKKVRPNYIPWFDIVLMVLGAAAFFYFAFGGLLYKQQSVFFLPHKQADGCERTVC